MFKTTRGKGKQNGCCTVEEIRTIKVKTCEKFKYVDKYYNIAN